MARKIRIMFVIVSMGNGRAGTERNLRTIIENLDPARFEPALVSVQDCEFMGRADHTYPVHCLRINRLFTPRMWMATVGLARRMRREQTDIVQTFAVDGHVVGGIAARLGGIRTLVSSRRDLGFAYGRKQKLFLGLANRFPNRFLANCRAVADTLSLT